MFCPGAEATRQSGNQRRCCAPGSVRLWVIVLLLVLTVVLNRLLLRPVLEVIRKREEAIDSARELARAVGGRGAGRVGGVRSKDDGGARGDLSTDGRDAPGGRCADAPRSSPATRAEAEAAVAKASRELQAEAEEARRRLEADAQALGAAAAERVLGRKAS